MPVALLRPGQTHGDVAKLKGALVRELLALGERELAAKIDPAGKTYGPAAVRGVERLQRAKGLGVDGIVGKDTWGALGVTEPVVDARPVLNGVPWEEGITAVDGIWVADPLAREIVSARKRGAWRGTLNSGYRPDWYQSTLYKAAVQKYGSEAAARKWVAPPGRSRHRFKDWRGAADANDGAALDAASPRIVRPMSWEPWHVQLAGRPDEEGVVSDEEVFGDEEAVVDETPPLDELQRHGVELADVEASVEELLALYESREG